MDTPRERDLADHFARHVVTAEFGALSEGAVRAAKQSTLDTLGVMLGASGLVREISRITELMLDWGGKPESTLVGSGGKGPVTSAAFTNGAMAHALDFDDHLPEGHHPSSCLVPALLALAERLGSVTGEQFITAVALGHDVFARLRKYVDWQQDWFMTPVIGTFAAAAACAKLLGLEQRQVVDALGIASLQAAGTMQLGFGVGGNLRGMYAGFGAKAGVFSALLAQAGITGTTTPFEGRAGFLEVYFDAWDRDAMLDGLGEDFQGETILYKLWPSCGGTHGYIDGALRLLGAAGREDEIAEVEVIGGDFARRLCEPLDHRRRPPTDVDAKFSIPYTVALAIVQGTVGVGDFTDERRTDPRITAMTGKVEFVPDEAYDWTTELPGGAIRITLASGETLSTEYKHDSIPGSSTQPLGWDELAKKFADCAGFSVRPLTDDVVDRVVEQTRDLEHSVDVTAIPRLLG